MSEELVSEGTSDSQVGSPADESTGPEIVAVDGPNDRKPTDLRIVRFFLLILGALLMAYAFLGRGFAHLGVGPIYVGEMVMALGIVATAWAALAGRFTRPTRSQISRSRFTVSLLVLLVLFMTLGLIRTVPYIGTYGMNALRDATLWGYGIFALMVFALVDRTWALRLFKLYGIAAIVFLFWEPVAYYIFTNSTILTTPGSFIYASSIIPNAPGTNIPILFFKSQDMAVQTAGAIAYLVVGTPLVRRLRDFLWRFAAAVPATWMVYITGTVTRGGLAAVAAAMAVTGVLSAFAGRLRNWMPVLAGLALVAVLVSTNVTIPSVAIGPPAPTPSAVVSGRTPKPTRAPKPTPTVVDWTTSRTTTTAQWWDNIFSIFGYSTNTQLQGTKAYRLAWWSKIMDYTFAGKYFWDGKGFGINLADSDHFQVTKDDSLREPPNSHLAVLARMGVPGFLLWGLLMLGFALFLLRALLAHRRAGDSQLAAVSAWVLAFWVAMMVNTTFDPYLEGPQGGIWFWALFGLGLVLIRLAPRRAASEQGASEQTTAEQATSEQAASEQATS